MVATARPGEPAVATAGVSKTPGAIPSPPIFTASLRLQGSPLSMYGPCRTQSAPADRRRQQAARPAPTKGRLCAKRASDAENAPGKFAPPCPKGPAPFADIAIPKRRFGALPAAPSFPSRRGKAWRKPPPKNDSLGTRPRSPTRSDAAGASGCRKALQCGRECACAKTIGGLAPDCVRRRAAWHAADRFQCARVRRPESGRRDGKGAWYTRTLTAPRIRRFGL